MNNDERSLQDATLAEKQPLLQIEVKPDEHGRSRMFLYVADSLFPDDITEEQIQARISALSLKEQGELAKKIMQMAKDEAEKQRRGAAN